MLSAGACRLLESVSSKLLPDTQVHFREVAISMKLVTLATFVIVFAGAYRTLPLLAERPAQQPVQLATASAG